MQTSLEVDATLEATVPMHQPYQWLVLLACFVVIQDSQNHQVLVRKVFIVMVVKLVPVQTTNVAHEVTIAPGKQQHHCLVHLEHSPIKLETKQLLTVSHACQVLFVTLKQQFTLHWSALLVFIALRVKMFLLHQCICVQLVIHAPVAHHSLLDVSQDSTKTKLHKKIVKYVLRDTFVILQ